MGNMDPQTSMILAGVILTALIAIAGWLAFRRNESHRLERRFGPEYGRAVDELGSRDKAEAELKARERRVKQFHIVPLVPADASRFSQQWKALQARFVDNPKGVVSEADVLVRELMQKRGYPMADFDRLSADLSVDYPTVVEHYRAGRSIAERDHRGEADTEELRKAVVHYRTLFDELLEVATPEPRSRDTALSPQPKETQR
jgi:hypothetical protein